MTVANQGFLHVTGMSGSAALTTINEAARLQALKLSFFYLSLIAVLPIAVAFFLPRKDYKLIGIKAARSRERGRWRR